MPELIQARCLSRFLALGQLELPRASFRDRLLRRPLLILGVPPGSPRRIPAHSLRGQAVLSGRLSQTRLRPNRPRRGLISGWKGRAIRRRGEELRRETLSRVTRHTGGHTSYNGTVRGRLRNRTL